MSIIGKIKGNARLKGMINKFYELRGYSAYEIAVLRGFVGTEEEWLASLQGKQGKQGVPGVQGPRGDKGEKGDKGDKGADGAMSFSDLTEEQKASLHGKDGVSVVGAQIFKSDDGTEAPIVSIESAEISETE